MSIRERPPLRLTVDAETPSGRHYRWALDERDPAYVPLNLSFGSTIPGGFETLACSLPRKPEIDYADLERLTMITVRSAGGSIVGQYRLESAPRTSGDQMAVSPGCVGFQAHLEDDKSVREIYIDRELSSWGPIPGSRGSALQVLGIKKADSSTDQADTGLPRLNMEISDNWSTAAVTEAWYDAGALGVGTLYWDRTSDSTLTVGQPSANFSFLALSTDDPTTFSDATADQHVAPADGETGAVFTPSAKRRWLAFQWSFSAAGGTSGEQFWSFLQNVAVLGRTGIHVQGDWPEFGMLASDVIDHAVTTWAPRLQREIIPSGAVIPQAAFKDATTVADVVSQMNRFDLYDWAVWNGEGDRPTFFYYPRYSRGKSWRARIAPSQLSEHGPDVQRLWNGVIIRYNDVDGTAKTVGPVGSGADTEDIACEDDDPDNEANRLGIRRWEVLDMNGISTPAAAATLGQVFLDQAKRLDRSGQAQLVGYVEDASGVRWPASSVRAGDTIAFVDAADSSRRRIVKASYDHDSRTAQIDLDAPPEGLAALLERMQLRISPELIQ